MPVLSRLKELREHAMLSQRDLAERARISQTTIVHAEAGHAVRLVTGRRLADALGVAPAELTKPPRSAPKDAAA